MSGDWPIIWGEKATLWINDTPIEVAKITSANTVDWSTDDPYLPPFLIVPQTTWSMRVRFTGRRAFNRAIRRMSIRMASGRSAGRKRHRKALKRKGVL